MYRSAFAFSTVFIVLLSIPGSVSSASVTLRPVARLRGGSGELFGELGYDGIVAPPAGGKSLRVRSLDGPDTYLLVESLGCGRGRVLLAARDPAPTRFAIEWAESRHVVSVDWSTAAVDRDLPAAWAAAARRHFNELSRQGELRPWARFALERLSVRDLAATPRGFPGAQGIRRTPHSAFELTTGAVAIEESLQLERLRGVGWGRRRDRPQDETIRVSSIPGVTIRSHPWSEMLAGRDPLPHAIERFLPLDQYSFEARSFRALIDLADWTDAIGSPAVEWLVDRADDSGVKARLERQLCLPTSVVARRLGPMVIRRVAAGAGPPAGIPSFVRAPTSPSSSSCPPHRSSSPTSRRTVLPLPRRFRPRGVSRWSTARTLFAASSHPTVRSARTASTSTGSGSSPTRSSA